jgi:hypothetical protein
VPNKASKGSGKTTVRHGSFAVNFAGRPAESIANEKTIVIDENLSRDFRQSCKTISRLAVQSGAGA